jgi:hypothetical protein
MRLFTRQATISVDLGDLSLEQIMNFPEEDRAGSEEFFINEVYKENHLQMRVKKSRVYTSGVHDFEYDPNKKEIWIFSRYNKSAFLVYGFLTLVLIPFIMGEDISEMNWKWLGLMVFLFAGISLLLIVGIKTESKEIERELIIRINSFRRNRIR